MHHLHCPTCGVVSESWKLKVRVDQEAARQQSVSRRRLVLGGGASLLALGASFVIANQESLPADDGTLGVATTVGMITDVVRNIGRDLVTVEGLMGPGIDPHSYKPSASDITTLGDADLILYGGLHLEGRMTETFEKIDRAGAIRTVGVSETIPEDRLRAGGQIGLHDPHVWFDVSLWTIVAETIAREFVRMMPEHEDTISRHLDGYRGQLDELDAWVFDRVATVPEERRVLITAHDAFGYFGDRYGFEVMGIQGLSTASEAGAADVQRLADVIAERQIPAIFIESAVPPSTVEAVQAAVQARGWSVTVGGELYADAMGTEGTPDGTYIGMVRHNVLTITGALTRDHDA